MVRTRDLAVLLLCCVCCAGFVSGLAAQGFSPVAVARAQAQALRGVMRLADPADEALFARVRGQVGDLDVALRAQTTPPIEPSLREQLDTSRVLAGNEAQIVIWAVRLPDKLEIVVMDLALDRVLVRALQSAEARDDRSAQDEAAALVVRSALKGSLAGAALGASPRELITEAAPVEPEPVAPEPPVVSAQPAVPHIERTPAWSIGAGAWLGADGQSVGGVRGLSARFAWLGRRVELGLSGGLGLLAEIEEPRARLRLAQHRVTAQVGWVPVAHDTWRLALLAGAGVALFATRVEPVDATFEASEDRRVLTLLEATVAATYTPRWARAGRVQGGLALGAGAAFFVQPLELGYISPTRDFISVQRTWPVQPMANLSLVLHI